MTTQSSPYPSTGETKSSVTVDTAKRNAARLAPPLCSERISPLLCRCFFLLFEGRGEGGVDVGFWLVPQASEIKAFRRGPPRTALAWLPLPPSISPLFDATTIHNAPLGRSGDMFEAVISHFTFEAKKVESGGEEGGRHRNHASGLDEA